MNEISGGGIVAKMLKLEGVEDFFGIPDGTYTHMFVSAINEGLKMHTPRHESAGAHMAGAFSVVTGKVGVCIASNGPGVANVLSGACIEHLEGHRVLLITSARRLGVTDPDRPGAYQAFNQHKVIREMSKWSTYVRDFARIPDQMREAFRRCWSGKPGLVHVDIPEDVINSFGPEPKYLTPGQYRTLESLKPAAEDVKAAAGILAEARLPLIQAGSGVIHALAFERLQKAASLLNAPVTTSWAGTTAISELSPNAIPIGLAEMVNGARKQADACLCLGSRMGETDYWGKFPYWAKTAEQKFIQVDLDADNIGRNRPVNLGITADVGAFLDALIIELEAMGSKAGGGPERKAMLEQIAGAKQQVAQTVARTLPTLPTFPMHTMHAMLGIRQAMPVDTLFVLDGGNTPVWAQSILCPTPNTRLSTWHMGHLSAGPGYAVGAAVGKPQQTVCLICGDGAFGMHMQEMETAVRYGLNLKFVIISDQQWGMVKATHIMNMKPHAERYAKALGGRGHVDNTDFGATDWASAARAMGCKGLTATNPQELAAALAEAVSTPGPVMVDVKVDSQAHMLCPALQYFKDMHAEPAGE
jgi:acetolactate synthase-1/2/3 large subunit